MDPSAPVRRHADSRSADMLEGRKPRTPNVAAMRHCQMNPEQLRPSSILLQGPGSRKNSASF